MAIELNSPSAIYETITDELIKVVESLNQTSDDPTLENAAKNTREQLKQLQIELQHQLAELQNNAEWDAFTIAFYGETGAGKSTVIETLRILLNESTKQATQKIYREATNEYETHQRALQQLQETIEIANQKLNQLEQQLKNIGYDFEQERTQAVEQFEPTERALREKEQTLKERFAEKEQAVNQLKMSIKQLTADINKQKQHTSLWQKLLNILRKLPEEKQFISLEDKLPQINDEQNSAYQALATHQSKIEGAQQELSKQLSDIQDKAENSKQQVLTQQKEAEQHKQRLLSEEQQLNLAIEDKLAELSTSADGQIIGDGRSDYTQRTQRYDFAVDGHQFAILDVPGIEGKEGQVVREIEKAVQTAHAVFYVTNKPAPPQTGDNQRKGTLEKIKQHLGTQTEVWSIFNKKVSNPQHALKERPLLSDDESSSLLTLENNMREHLGSHFQSAIPLTALPAFLASTECLLPNSQHAKRRQKCLKDFSETELIEASRMQSFIDMLSHKLLPSSTQKIKQSNFHKAKSAVDSTTDALDVLEKTFKKLAQNLKDNRNSAQHQLKSSFSALQKRLDSRGQSLIRQFASNVRQSTYGDIEDDISNDRFKQELKAAIEKQQEQLNEALPETMAKEVKQFEREAADILQRFEEQTQELSSISEKLAATKLNSDLKLKIEIDNGVNMKGLITSLIGGAISIPLSGGAGLFFVIASAAGLLLSIGKSVASFFSTSYKMSQQRKATEENLRDIKSKLRDSFDKSLNQSISDMRKVVDELNNALNAPVKQTEESSKLLHNANVKLKTLSQEVNTLGIL
ncbi:UNVERIFIED_ORG: hypothetical protein DFO82_1515 [Idiomarina abyssalis]|uniref:DUF726 domain-containing protein n=1 Tax=Idiomarina sp. 017G TaxID=2183988 RepID=UPI000E0E2220|nr:DUF726 domain-containing protein [Idiomarina sp. 017G]TDO50219.1 hypothetical protein DEU30_10473 [Idiomarina sp. 017G]